MKGKTIFKALLDEESVNTQGPRGLGGSHRWRMGQKSSEEGDIGEAITVTPLSVTYHFCNSVFISAQDGCCTFVTTSLFFKCKQWDSQLQAPQLSFSTMNKIKVNHQIFFGLGIQMVKWAKGKPIPLDWIIPHIMTDGNWVYKHGGTFITLKAHILHWFLKSHGFN